MTDTTDGTLLGGKIHYRQFKSGHRTGFEPVLLAAAIPARPGERILEAGTGAGAGLLCLGHRVKKLSGTGLEIDPALARLANQNFKLNGLSDFSCVSADAASPPVSGVFDHAFANPPWFDPATTHSPDPARARAHHALPGLLDAWIAGLTACLKSRGTLTLILPAGSLSAAMSALRAARYGAIQLFPLWPQTGQPAKQFIISAIRMRQTPDRLLPGLALHDANGLTPDAQNILTRGAALKALVDRETPHKTAHSHPAPAQPYPADD